MAGAAGDPKEKDKGGYSVVDASLLLPYLKPRVWEPVAARIPDRVSANTITLAGSLCALACLMVVLLMPPEQPGWYALAAFFVFGYLNLDNLDGAHARRTGRSAPMGEFIDHWLDTANGGLVAWAVACAIQLPPWAILAVLASNTVAFHGTFAEQQLTGDLHMGLFGNIEGLVIAIALLLAIALFGTAPVADVKLLGPITFAWAMAIWTLAQNSWTAIASTVRCGRGYGAWLPLLLSLAATALWFVTGEVPFVPIAVMMVLINTLFSGGRIVTAILGVAGPAFDRLVTAVIVAGAGLSLGLGLTAEVQAALAWAAVAVLAGCVSWDFVRTARGRAQDLQRDELLGWFFGR